MDKNIKKFREKSVTVLNNASAARLRDVLLDLGEDIYYLSDLKHGSTKVYNTFSFAESIGCWCGTMRPADVHNSIGLSEFIDKFVNTEVYKKGDVVVAVIESSIKNHEYIAVVDHISESPTHGLRSKVWIHINKDINDSIEITSSMRSGTGYFDKIERLATREEVQMLLSKL